MSRDDTIFIWFAVIILAIFGICLYSGMTKFEYRQEVDKKYEEAKVVHHINVLNRTNYLYKKLLGELIERVVHCESGGVHQQWGDIDYPYPAYGVAQFQHRTFEYLKGLAGLHSLEWRNENDQLVLLRWAIENGYGNYWTCYRQITEGTNEYSRYFG